MGSFSSWVWGLFLQLLQILDAKTYSVFKVRVLSAPHWPWMPLGILAMTGYAIKMKSSSTLAHLSWPLNLVLAQVSATIWRLGLSEMTALVDAHHASWKLLIGFSFRYDCN